MTDPFQDALCACTRVENLVPVMRFPHHSPWVRESATMSKLGLCHSSSTPKHLDQVSVNHLGLAKCSQTQDDLSNEVSTYEYYCY